MPRSVRGRREFRRLLAAGDRRLPAAVRQPDGDPTDVIQLDERDKFVWHALRQGHRAGQLYGYKVRGEYRPEWGLRFNDAKLLLDPYAKAVTGKFRNIDNLLLAYDPQPGAGEARPGHAATTRRSFPKAIVVDDAFDWQGRRPRSAARAARDLRSARQGLHRASLVRRADARHLSRIHREDPASRRGSASTPSSSCRSTSTTSTTSCSRRG